VCLSYAEVLRQHHDSSSILWSVPGWVLGGLSFIVAYVFFRDHSKEAKDSDKRNEQ
jgi:hypothetical protein